MSKRTQADLLDSHSRTKETSPLPKEDTRYYVKVGRLVWAQSELNQEECTLLEVPASWLSSLASVLERRTIRREHEQGLQTRITQSDAGIHTQREMTKRFPIRQAGVSESEMKLHLYQLTSLHT